MKRWIVPRYIFTPDAVSEFQSQDPDEQTRQWELFWRLSARDVADPYRLKALEDERDAAAFLSALTRLGSARFLRHIHSVISIKTDS